VSEFHVEVGAYALDALDESERAAFEQHLAGCRSCQRELAEFTETTVRLSAPGDIPPPAELRGSLLDAIRQVRPLPPLDAPSPVDAAGSRANVTEPGIGRADPEDPNTEDPNTKGAPTQDIAPRRALRPASHPQPDPASESARDLGSAGGGAPSDELALRRLKRQGRRSRVLTLAVAAVTVIALAFGGWAYVLQRQQHTVAAQAAAANQLLSAPDVKTYPVTVSGAPATFVVSKSLDKAMFVGADLPAAAQGRTYQLWTVTAEKQADPDVTFVGGPDTNLFLDGDISNAAGLAVSIEPAGGSSQPTEVLATTAL
jgi:anti-sigma-K factor RskA